MIPENTNNIVDNALIAGVRLDRIMPNIYTGRVVAPGPAKKNDIMKSSIDIANAKRAPERIPGASNGKVMWRKIFHSLAPRSLAASNGLVSKDCSRARIGNMANGIQNAVCAKTRAVKPRGILIARNTLSVPIAKTISGIIKGAPIKPQATALPARPSRNRPKVAMIAKMVEKTVANAATDSEFVNARAMSVLSNTSKYHLTLKPCQIWTNRLLLNE